MMCLKLERNLWDWIMSNTFRHWASRSASAAPRSYLIPFIFGEAAPSLLQGTVSHIELRRQQRSEHDGDAAAAAAGIFGAGCAGGLRRHFRRLGRGAKRRRRAAQARWRRSKAEIGGRRRPSMEYRAREDRRRAQEHPGPAACEIFSLSAKHSHSTPLQQCVYACMYVCMYNITMNDIIYI